MNVDTELVAIGISLLAIILATWAYLHSIDKKLDKLLVILGKSNKKEKHPNHTNNIQTNHQNSFANAIRSHIKKGIRDL